jgi:signal transduction histidine kinase
MHSEKLCFIACSNLFPEINHLLNNDVYPDIEVKCIKSFCMGCTDTNKTIELINDYGNKYSKVIFITSCCINFNQFKKNINDSIEIIQLSQCFNLFLNDSLIDFYLNQRKYIVTNGWLRNYDQQLKNWDFDEKSAKSFFKESASEILLLDTGITDDYLPDLKIFSDYIGLTYSILPVGLSFCKLILDNKIIKWRETKQSGTFNDKLTIITRKTADYAFVFNQLHNLLEITDEKVIVQDIFSLLNILFMPQNIVYTPIINNEPKDAIFYNSNPNTDITNSENGFNIELIFNQELIGTFELIGIKFYEYISKYTEISNVIAGISTLALVNARKFDEILSANNTIKEYSAQLEINNIEKDKFFSIIAHDLLSPLSGFIGLTEMMAEDTIDFSIKELQNISKNMQISASNLFALLKNLLEWSRIQRGMIEINKVQLDLKSIVAEIQNIQAASAIKKQIELIDTIPFGTIIFADKHMISTIIRNLVSNALKFTKQGGKIEIGIIESSVEQTEIYIKDTGIGMNEYILNNLFKIDKKVSRSGTNNEPSTGLGLLLCKEFIEKHGGKIWAESEEGKGSTFYFSLPKENEYIINDSI